MLLTSESLDFKFILTAVKGLIRILSKMLLKDNKQRLTISSFRGVVVAVAVSQAPYENFTSSFGRQ